jgi:zinc and cadmium transporter
MINSGISKRKAILYNIYSGLTALVGAVLALYASNYTKIAMPYILALSAASFIYIALADLIPELHKKNSFRDSLKQFSLLLVGITVIVLSILYKP